MDDAAVIEEILNGASLRVFMVPDSAIPSNFPEHIETYDLPHVIINGSRFWAKSQTGHCILRPEDEGSHNPLTVNSGFCYTNYGDILCSYNPFSGTCVIMDKKRYKQHEWRPKKDHRLIWDSANGGSTRDVADAIRASLKLKVAMLDADDIWNIHPVDLPMYYPGTETFELKTINDGYPTFFRSSDLSLAAVQKIADEDRKNLLETVMDAFPTYYALSSDGTYRNFFDIQRKTKQTYQRLKVFAEMAPT